MGLSVHSLRVTSGFGGRAGYKVSIMYPPGCAGSHHLGGRWGWRWRDVSARVRCGTGLLFCSVANTILLVAGTGTEALKVRSELVPFPLSVCSPPTPPPSIGAFSPERSSTGAKGPGACACYGQGHMLGPSWLTSQFLSCSLFAVPMDTSNGFPCTVWMPHWVQAGSVPHNCVLSSAPTFAPVWSWHHRARGQSRCSVQAHRGGFRKSPQSQAVSVRCLCFVSGVSKCVRALH